ncbi:MAG TPA: tRNA lysidine(34) synthetase TilS [Stellaceae bacterium]|nr:tRNA lysidine(34) synthetase TilS [Stellaceae bacterium]
MSACGAGGTAEPASPLGAEEFAALLARFAPFEPAPRLAVAVSGGADSMALTLLAWRWAEAAGGSLTALTVDHRLRAASADEAEQVARWLSARGIPHRTLRRDEAPPARGLQAAARAARYRLLEAWCAGQGVLHLLVAHNREDQAETLLLRLARGSGLDGLAGMPAVAEHRQCRVLRPLLDLPRARLEATLRGFGQPWIEDPSNRNPAYARVRVRQAQAQLAEAGLGPARLAATAARLGRARSALEAAVAALLAAAVLVHPEGFVRFDGAALRRAPAEIGLRALAVVLSMVGGGAYPPRLERLERLYRDLPEALGGGRTLGGCRVLPQPEGVLVCREAEAVAPPVAAPPGGVVYWDGRFSLYLPPEAPEGLRLGALGATPLGAARGALPIAVRAGLPAIRQRETVVAVPALGYTREGVDSRGWNLLFRPTRPMSGAGFTVV